MFFFPEYKNYSQILEEKVLGDTNDVKEGENPTIRSGEFTSAS